MSLFARIKGGIVTEVSIDPANQFHTDIAREFEPVPDNVKAGWRKVGNTWIEPTNPGTPTKPKRKTDLILFKLLFSTPERIHLKSLITTDPIIKDFFEIIDDVRITSIDMESTFIIDSVNYCVDLLVTAGIILEEDRVTRTEEILSGNIP